MFGYVGRIARVDLTNGFVKVEEVPDWLIDCSLVVRALSMDY